MVARTNRRGVLVLTLSVCVVVLFLALATLNAFNLRVLNPASSTRTVVFLALSIVAFLLFVGVLVLLVRNVLKLYADQRSRVLGTRLRTRMLGGAVLVSVVPLVFMFFFSYLLLNRAVDRWFAQPVTQLREDADRMAFELFRYAAANARFEAETIAIELSDLPSDTASDSIPQLSPKGMTEVRRVLHRHQLTLQGGFVLLYHGGHLVLAMNMPTETGNAEIKTLRPPASPSGDDTEDSAPVVETELQGPAEQAILRAAQRNDDPFYSLGPTDYTLATATLRHGDLVVTGLPIPAGVSTASARLRSSANDYWRHFRERRQVRNLYMSILLMTTALALFACCWLALNLSKQVTRPVESLADAMEAIASGDYARRVGESATEELGELAHSFNAMATDLETAHTLANTSTRQLSQLNAALQQRRTELEIIIETIPNGVVTLDANRQIVLANRAFSEMLDPGGQRQFVGLALDAVLPHAIVDDLDRLLRRAHRMGLASAEMEAQSGAGTLHLSATVALLEGGAARPETKDLRGQPGTREHLGYVLVLEDATELLRAQKQMAWKEVARRVAHEIKNPLTPISLNAELIARHIARLKPVLEERGVETPSAAVIQRSANVISSSVETMRSLVDQFSALAEFPSAQPRPADLNAIVADSLALFTGRMGSIRVRRSLAADLPAVLADPEALKRALSNLIDNAAEAMQEALLRELQIGTRLLATGMVELTVADTGPGVTDDMRERLFLPYFSTKQRGTGLGLSIAAKIVQEHRGSIRVEKNLPTGARFILELQPASAEPAHAEPARQAAVQPPSGWR